MYGTVKAMLTSKPEDFENLARGLVHAQTQVKANASQLSRETKNYGVLLCAEAVFLKESGKTDELKKWWKDKYGVEPTSNAYTCAKVYQDLVLPGRVTEMAYHARTTNAIIEAGRVMNACHGDYAHEAVNLTVTILNGSLGSPVNEISAIRERLVDKWLATDETGKPVMDEQGKQVLRNTQEQKTDKLVAILLTVEQATAVAMLVTNEYAHQELARIIKGGQFPTLLAAIENEALTSADPEVAKRIILSYSKLGEKLTANTVDTTSAEGVKVKVRRFTDEQLAGWTAECTPGVKITPGTIPPPAPQSRKGKNKNNSEQSAAEDKSLTPAVEQTAPVTA